VGPAVSRLPVLLGLTFCVGLRLRWWDAWLGEKLVERLDQWWFFLLVFYGLYQAIGFVSGRLERAVYRGGRDDLLALLAAEDVDRDSLLAMVEGDAAVGRVGHQLKLDREAAPRPG